MKFIIEFKSSVEKDLKKIDRRFLDGILKKISCLENFPTKGDIKKLINADGFYRLRIGEFRVIFRMEDRIITVFYIRHRKDSYR